jgi:hypothetical protein
MIMTQKTKSIIGWVLTGLLSLAFLASASMKLIGGEEAAKGASAMGISATAIKIIAALEILSILLFIFPRTGLLGTLLLVAYVGGVIVTHLEHQQAILIPIVIQCLVWIAAAIRFPELSRRLTGNALIA